MATGVAAEVGVPSDSAAFDGLVRSEQRRLFLLCWRMLGDPDEAGTAVQDVFLKVHRALGRNAPEVEDSARWLTRIAVNTCLDRLRSRRWQFWRKRADPATEEAVLREFAGAAPGAEEQVFAQQVSARLQAALCRLSDRQRAVFLLRHYEDRSLDEIAALLGIDTGSVKSHMFRAIAKLRNELRDLYDLGKKR